MPGDGAVVTAGRAPEENLTDHFVQFYQDDASLVESLADYVRCAIESDEAVVVIATAAHRSRLRRVLRNRGVDLAAARRRSQYVPLDADATLAKLMRGPDPDAAAFDAVIGGCIRKLARAWPAVRAFGEMVTRLCDAGNRDGALRLEALWEELARLQRFSLYCAYPLRAFSGDGAPAFLDSVCRAHSHLIPAESFSDARTRYEQLREVVLLQQKAERLEHEIEQREASERELADFVENAIEGLHKVGADGTILWANGAELRMLGYEPSEYIGHHIAEFHVDAEVIDAMLCRLLSGESLINHRARLRCKDGSIKNVLIHSNGCFVHGKFAYSRCFTRDVTDIERAHQDSSMLATVVECSNDAIITKALDGTITTWNPAATRMFGYTADEAIGSSVAILIPADRLQEEAEIFERLREGNTVEHYETVRLAKDGRRIDISLTVSPIRDEHGAVTGVSTIARDVTDRMRADRALRDSERRFSAFMECLPGLAWIKDSEGRYVYANRAVEGPFGMKCEQLYGKTDSEVFSAETARQFRENDERALATGDGVRVIEALEHEDGVHYSLVSKFPIDAGETRYIGGVAIDITDRMRAEAALVESDRRKDEFLATLAHELRNPLAPIRNSLHILRMQDGGSAARDRVHEMMERQVAHMVRLVDDLLELSRISRGKIELRKERVYLRDVIEQALETSKPHIEGGGHVIRIELPDEPVLIEADPVRLAQVFANLFNNAAKYTTEPGTITVAGGRRGGTVSVSIIDTGIGIPAGMLSRVFEMFAQVDNPLRRSQDGLGIGLSLVRTLVGMHGGTIEARSEGLARGSEFIVTLPVADSATSEHDDPRTWRKGEGRTVSRILVVDDNRDAADSMGMMLRFLGADVQVAYDGPSALEVTRIVRPDVVLMDLGMPGMSGYDVVRRMREDPICHSVLFIALTGWGQDEDRRRSREAGFHHHLVKPVDLGALQALLASRESRA
ncbi:MAG TPA: PAS domain S-box protein [Candidatus Limnocylindrales bacterium]|nr:PAS domain S-box protein [Candidatus Limnocylindrales bacterium]